jgi:hypothetical protein
MSCLRVALDAGWLDAVANTDEKGITAARLAAGNEADVGLVVRVMRLLAAADSVAEIDVDTYASNEYTAYFTKTGIRQGIRHL